MEQRKHSGFTEGLGAEPGSTCQVREQRPRLLGFDWALLPQGWARDVVFSVSVEGRIVKVLENGRTESGNAASPGQSAGTGVASQGDDQNVGFQGVDSKDAASRDARDVASRGRGSEDVSWTRGSAVPGMPNVHSHAHQRLMAGLAERSGPGDDSFWTWREVMYAFAGKLDPEGLQAAAAMAYVEMLEAGFTAVGEFQYLHNQPDGSVYDQRADLSLRCLAAARSTGIAITLLPVLYCRGGFDGRDLKGGQRRFAADVDGLVEIVTTLGDALGTGRAPCVGKVPSETNARRMSMERVGIAPHSLRAVSIEHLAEAVHAIRAIDPRAPVHLHISEQIAEVQDCVNVHGRRPVEYLFEQMHTAGHPVDERWCLVHATHLSRDECRDLAASRAVVGLCPTTEANLGDGVFSGKNFLVDKELARRSKGGLEERLAGGIAIGTDSQVRISVIEDLRQLETSQRLVHHQRNVLAEGSDTSTGRTLLHACTSGGAQALNQPMGSLAVGQRADFVVLDVDHPRLMERTEDDLLDSWIFAGDSDCVSDVYVAGEQLVKEGRHVQRDRVIADFRQVVHKVRV